MEHWTEVNLHPARGHDPELLVGLVDPLVHGALRDGIETWFFFWEPELRLRLRWVDPPAAEVGRVALFEALEGAVASGLALEWYEGAHGAPGERYVGEAEVYGPEAWPAVQKDWMNGSELALLLARHEDAGTLTRPRRFHWERHTHLVTNQLYGTWEDEVELCLAQALGYLRHIVNHGGRPSPEVERLVAELGTAVRDP
jgi:Lantibiotic biosynthesis dehydratase C-term